MFHSFFQEEIKKQKDNQQEESNDNKKNDNKNNNLKGKKVTKKRKKETIISSSSWSLPSRSSHSHSNDNKHNTKSNENNKFTEKDVGSTTNTETINNNDEESDDDIFSSKKSSKSKQQNQNQHKKLSEEAIQLSSKLKLLSSQKQYNEAITLYNLPKYNKIRDGYHACIMIDCCSRCGYINVGEKILDGMKICKNNANNKMKLSIQAYTALLKGYVHCGLMDKATLLFYEICNYYNDEDDSNGVIIQPNVRTLNTLLRGCQWSATTPTTTITDNNKMAVTGGILSSEYGWKIIKNTNNDDNDNNNTLFYDVSSYEYTINLISQSLQTSKAITRLHDMKNQLNNNKNEEDESCYYESYAFCYYYIVRSLYIKIIYGCSKKKKYDKKLFKEYSKNALEYVDKAILYYSNMKNNNDDDNLNTHGGKRAWKKKDNNEISTSSSTSRISSNIIFRNHRLTELKNDILSIINKYKTHNKDTNNDKTSNILIYWMITRFIYISGGGTTTNDDTTSSRTLKHNNNNDLRMNMLLTLWISYGLSTLVGSNNDNDNDKVETVNDNSNNSSSLIIIDKLSSKDIKSMHKSISSLLPKEEKKNNNELFTNNYLDTNGYLNFDFMFHTPDAIDSTTASKNKNTHLELGAGSGDWIISQAMHNNTNDNYIALDLRADRVYQTFSKSVLNSSANLLWNLSCVGCDSLYFLQCCIPIHSLSTVYVNHPEPPTQVITPTTTTNSADTYGTTKSYHNDNNISDELYSTLLSNNNSNNKNEPSHMLSSNTIRAITTCLLKNGQGKLIIVTDNLSYAKLICITILKVNMDHRKKKKKKNSKNNENTLLLQSMNEHDLLQNSSSLIPPPLEPFEIFNNDKSYMIQQQFNNNNYNLYPNKKIKYSNNKKGLLQQQYYKDDESIILYKGYPCESIGHYNSCKNNSGGGGNSYFDRLWRTGVGSKYAEVDKRYIIALKTSSPTATATTTS